MCGRPPVNHKCAHIRLSGRAHEQSRGCQISAVACCAPQTTCCLAHSSKLRSRKRTTRRLSSSPRSGGKLGGGSTTCASRRASIKRRLCKRCSGHSLGAGSSARRRPLPRRAYVRCEHNNERLDRHAVDRLVPSDVANKLQHPLHHRAVDWRKAPKKGKTSRGAVRRAIDDGFQLGEQNLRRPSQRGQTSRA